MIKSTTNEPYFTLNRSILKSYQPILKSYQSYVIFIVIFTNFMLHINASSWQLKEINIPIITNIRNSVDLKNVEEVLKSITNTKVVWVIGKFKVGKSFIIDYIRNDGNITSNPVLNTIGLKIYYDGLFSVIDTEGLLQPVGDNDVYFIKQFLIYLMIRTADTLVFVSDQMDVSDLEQYNYLKEIFWGSEIAEMFYVHNCKSLEESQLEVYRSKISKYVNLNSIYWDDHNEKKPVSHIFIPKLPVSKTLLAWLADWYKKTNYPDVNILGKPMPRRNKLNTFNYMMSISDALSSIGAGSLTEININNNTFKYEGNITGSLDVIQLKHMWCVDDTPGVIFLYVKINIIEEIIIINSNEFILKVLLVNNVFKVINSSNLMVSPVKIIDPDKQQWDFKIHQSGFIVIKMYTSNSKDFNPITRKCPTNLICMKGVCENLRNAKITKNGKCDNNNRIDAIDCDNIDSEGFKYINVVWSEIKFGVITIWDSTKSIIINKVVNWIISNIT
jgi:hypothetical protein